MKNWKNSRDQINTSFVAVPETDHEAFNEEVIRRDNDKIGVVINL